jgi:hypothetical protein
VLKALMVALGKQNPAKQKPTVKTAGGERH